MNKDRRPIGEENDQGWGYSDPYTADEGDVVAIDGEVQGIEGHGVMNVLVDTDGDGIGDVWRAAPQEQADAALAQNAHLIADDTEAAGEVPWDVEAPDEDPSAQVWWGNEMYTVDQVDAGPDGGAGLPPEFTILSPYASGGSEAGQHAALIDRPGIGPDGVPDMIIYNVAPEQWEKWRQEGRLLGQAPGSLAGDGYTGDQVIGDLAMSDFGGEETPPPDFTGETAGGTFMGSETVVVDQAAMTRFVAAVRSASAAFESAVTPAELRAARVEPGQFGAAAELRGMFAPGGKVTDYFAQHVGDLPLSLETMCRRLESAAAEYTRTQGQLEMSATDLVAAMDAGAGHGAASDIGHDDIT